MGRAARANPRTAMKLPPKEPKRSFAARRDAAQLAQPLADMLFTKKDQKRLGIKTCESQ
jgi:hypothetical protein